ncbi:MAG TPA: hypothetical protein VM597_15565, partial [Gemmataceae bacterium]|nr:hypothetical protein [Gemmataceae bacterium]
ITTEPFHVLVRPELAASGFPGLRGKRVALGPSTLASHHVGLEVLAFVGLRPAAPEQGGYTLDPVSPEALHHELQRIASLADADRAQPLRALPDAVLFSAPVPSTLARVLVETAGYHLLPVSFAEAFCNERLNPPNSEGVQVVPSLLTQTTIPAYTYNFHPPMPAQTYPTVGIPLLLIARDDADSKAVGRLLETIYDSPLKNQIRPQPLDNQIAAFPLHPATERYLHRTDPIVKREHAEKIGPLLGGVGTLITGLFALYSYMRLRKLKRFEVYYRDIGRIDMIARGLEVDPELPTELEALRVHLEVQLARLKHNAITDFAEGGLQGEGLLAGLIALLNDTRESLAAIGARNGIRPSTAAGVKKDSTA